METTNYLLALGILGMQLAGAALLMVFFFRKQIPSFEKVATFVRTQGMWIGFVLTLAGSFLTLYYSEVLGFPPCPLCWWQRIFLYPQVILFALALWRKERVIVDYSTVLSVVGFGFALYHHALQVLPSGSLPCPAEGTISCAQRFVFEFGYITFPLMAATIFAFLIVLMLFSRERKQDV